MFRRLLLALLVLCLAAPAMAAPVHCEPARPQIHHAVDGDHAHHGNKAPADTQPFIHKAHDCIGCGVPQFGAASVPEMMPYPATPAVTHRSTLAEPRPARPETPPPRA